MRNGSGEGIYCLVCGDVLQPCANVCEKCGNRTHKGRRWLFRYTVGSLTKPYLWLAVAVAVLGHLGAWLFVGDGAIKWDAHNAKKVAEEKVKVAEEKIKVAEYSSGTQWLLTHFKDSPWYTWVAHERTRIGQNSHDSLEEFVDKNPNLRLAPEQAALISAHLCWMCEKEGAGEILTRLTVSKEELENYGEKTTWLVARFTDSPWEAWIQNERERKTCKSDESLKRFVSSAPDLTLTPEQYVLIATNLRWEDSDDAASRLKSIVDRTVKRSTAKRYRAETDWLVKQFDGTAWQEFVYHERVVNREKQSDTALECFAKGHPFVEVTPELCVLILDNLWWDNRNKTKTKLEALMKDYSYKEGTEWLLSHFDNTKWYAWVEYHRYHNRNESSFEDLKRFLWEQDSARSVALTAEQAKLVHAHLLWGDNKGNHSHEAFKLLSGYVKPGSSDAASGMYLTAAQRE